MQRHRTKNVVTSFAVALATALFAAGSAQADFITPVDVTGSGWWMNSQGFIDNVINNSGLSANSAVGTHDNNGSATTMWFAGNGMGTGGGAPVVADAFLTFDLGQPYDLAHAYVWQMNQGNAVNNTGQRNTRTMDIYVSSDDVTYTQVGGTRTLSTADGSNAALPAETVSLSANNVRYVRFDVQTAGSGLTNEYVGLSEVRFESALANPNGQVVGGVSIEDVSSELVTSFDRAAINTINRNGLHTGGPNTHSNAPDGTNAAGDGTMWLNAGNGCCGDPADPTAAGIGAQITYDLGKETAITNMRVWNYNEGGGARGINQAEVRVSSDNISYTSLGVQNFTQASGATATDFSQLIAINSDARYVRLIAQSSHSGDNEFLGLSEVQFQTDSTTPQISGVVVDSFSTQLVGGPFDRQANYAADGSGLNAVNHHSNTPEGTSWLSASGDTTPQITFDLGGLYDVEGLQVWNYNEVNLPTRGADDVDIYVSQDGDSYSLASSTHFAIAPGISNVDFSEFFLLNTQARYIRLDILSNHGAAGFTGLSEVQFFGEFIPPTPEPSTALLAMLALVGLTFGRRRPTRSVALMAVLTVCCVMSSDTATAATVDAFVGAPNNPTTTRTDTFAQAGFGFYATTLGTKEVNRLGFWVSPENSGNTGVTAIDHDIALYNFNGATYTQIAAATVPAGSTADANGYAWASIPTLTLSDTSQGLDFYIVTASVGTDIWAPFTGSANVPTLDSTFGTRTNNGWFSGAAAPGIGGTATFNLANGNGGYFGPNVGFLAPTPEPSTALLAMLALAGLAFRRGRRNG